MDRLLNLPAKRQRDRRWEDLDPDCLANVFARVGMESLLLFVPFVCKSWYRASLNPICYERIIFPDNHEGIDPWSLDENAASLPWTYENHIEGPSFDYFIRRFAREFQIKWTDFSVPDFFKMVINRGNGNTKFLKIPGICSYYTAAIEEILEHINKKCKNFVGLHLADASIGSNEISAIAKLVPNVKFLCFRQSSLEKDDLLILIKELKDLVLLDVRECEGFDERDEEILKLASHIPKFLCRGSKTQVDPDNWDAEIVEVIEIDEE